MGQSSFQAKMRIVLLQPRRGADPDRAWNGAEKEIRTGPVKKYKAQIPRRNRGICAML